MSLLEITVAPTNSRVRGLMTVLTASGVRFPRPFMSIYRYFPLLADMKKQCLTSLKTISTNKKYAYGLMCAEISVPGGIKSM
jgi:hypothetical protein